MDNQTNKAIIAIEELQVHPSQLQKDALQTEARKIALGLKNGGLMAPELCLIAHYILADYSETARKQIQMFDVDLPETVRKAEELLKSLGG